MILLLFRELLASLIALALAASTASPALKTGQDAPEHERLRLRNDFKTPEEVVRYYCARDASGFVWSGLLDSERRAFTLWQDTPQADSFLVARSYRITTAAARADHATVEVRYELVGVGDGHGTRAPAAVPERVVRFDLRKVGGAWKIAKPEPAEISPVVLESKFPSSTDL